jgi:serine phosphatase RsbU (regulator of sigma subunit)
MASAAAIQRAMLPGTQPAEIAAARFDIHPFMAPAREVGGDLYDIVKLGAHVPAKWPPVRGQEHAQTKESTRVLLSIGDVCGKGIPAALFMAITQTVMRLAVRSGDDLGAEVIAANRQLAADNAEGMFTTLFCGVLDLATGTLSWCNAGHPAALVLRQDGTFEPLRVGGPPLGIVDTARYVPKSVTLAPGDLLFLYSDGVTEAENMSGVAFDEGGLQIVIGQHWWQDLNTLGTSVLRAVEAHAAGAKIADDLTVLAVRRPVPLPLVQS